MILAPPREISARSLARPFALVVAAAGFAVLTLRFAVSARLPTWAASVLVPASALALVFAVFRAGVALGPLAEDERGEIRPIHHRHGFWLCVLAIGAALPMLGAFSLIDPWETHYAEVAREMIERRDFVSPWWAHEGWFMSKPVLTLWLEALSMTVLGVPTGPDQILAGATSIAARPEWAVRMPAFVMAAVGAYVLYNGVSRTCGRRAGFIGGVVLWTMPGYALLSHQALTDMPLVASVAASLGFLLRALETRDEAHVSCGSIRFGARILTFHAGHFIAMALLVLTLPQLAILLSGHVHFDANGLRLGADRLVAGSPNACSLPGQPACAAVSIAHRRLQPFVQVAVWTPLIVWLTARLATETRAARLFAIAAWTAAAVGAMAKGPVALVVPAAGALIAIGARRSLRPLLRLEILPGLLVVVVLVAPWYVAMYARHGRVFFDELVLRNMLGRTLEHLHDTNAGEDVGLTYFVKQLGYAAFPWSGLALAALLSMPLQDDTSRRAGARALLFGATVFAFALVSSMGTKFHHYGLVALPGVAMLVGTWLDERVTEASSGRTPAWRARSAASSALFVGAALVVVLVARDLAVAPSGVAPSGAAHLVALMTYRYDRRWPSTDAFASAIAAAAIVFALACTALAVRAWRGRALVAGIGCAVALTVLLLDGYLVRAASDGGQRGIYEAYYRAMTAEADGTDQTSARPRAPLIAYQLNWKGENFYTGNDVAIFVKSGATMRTYLEARKRRHEDTVYFVTERGRVASLRAELGGGVRSFEELTGPLVSHEFRLVRAEL